MRPPLRWSTWPSRISPRSGLCPFITGSLLSIALPLNLLAGFPKSENDLHKILDRLISHQYSFYGVMTDEYATHLLNTIDRLIPRTTTATPQPERRTTHESGSPKKLLAP